MKSGVGKIFALLFFVGFFGYCVWHLEVPACRILIHQHRAASFSVVQGKVISGSVREVGGTRHGSHYHPSFYYKYQVGGKNYYNRRYRYDGLPSFSESWVADQVVRDHPPGSDIQVYYNPADPHDAVLSTPVKAGDIALLLIGTMLCLIPMWLIIRYGPQMFSFGKAGRVAGGVKIISERMTTRVRLPQRNPLPSSLSAMILLSFISEIAIGVDMDMRLEFAEMMALFVVLGGVGVYFWLWWKNFSGSQDLVIDEAARTLQLPLTYKRRQRIQCAFSDVAGVYAARVTHRRRNGVD